MSSRQSRHACSCLQESGQPPAQNADQIEAQLHKESASFTYECDWTRDPESFPAFPLRGSSRAMREAVLLGRMQMGTNVWVLEIQGPAITIWVGCPFPYNYLYKYAQLGPADPKTHRTHKNVSGVDCFKMFTCFSCFGVGGAKLSMVIKRSYMETRTLPTLRLSEICSTVGTHLHPSELPHRACWRLGTRQ